MLRGTCLISLLVLVGSSPLSLWQVVELDPTGKSQTTGAPAASSSATSSSAASSSAASSSAAATQGVSSSIEDDDESPAERKTYADRFDLVVREDIFAGFNGDEAAMKRGLDACEEVLQENPQYAEALVWRGAARVFIAGQAFGEKDMRKGMQFWTQGLQDMDRAVELEPQNIAVRIPRAVVLLPAAAGSPEAFAKPLLTKAKEDLEFIYETQANELDRLGEHPLGELRMGLADVYRRLGEAERSKEQLQAVQKELPQSAYAKRASEWLAAPPEATLIHNCLGCHDGGE